MFIRVHDKYGDGFRKKWKYIISRACLKKAFRELRVPVCGRFYPNEGGVAGYGNRMRVKYTAKWGLQIAEMIFQTGSSTVTITMIVGVHIQRGAVGN